MRTNKFSDSNDVYFKFSKTELFTWNTLKKNSPVVRFPRNESEGRLMFLLSNLYAWTEV